MDIFVFFLIIAVLVLIAPIVIFEVLRIKRKLQDFVFSISVISQIGVNVFIISLMMAFPSSFHEYCSGSYACGWGVIIFAFSLFVIGNLWMFLGFAVIKIKSLKERKRINQLREYSESQNPRPQQ